MGKQLIWIDDGLAKDLKIINDVAVLQDREIRNIIKKLKDDIDSMEKCIDESVISFR